MDGNVLHICELSPPEIPREKLAFDDPGATQTLLGQSNSNLKLVERETGAALHVRGNEVTMSLMERLHNFQRIGIREPLVVRVPLETFQLVATALSVHNDAQHCRTACST